MERSEIPEEYAKLLVSYPALQLVKLLDDMLEMIVEHGELTGLHDKTKTQYEGVKALRDMFLRMKIKEISARHGN